MFQQLKKSFQQQFKHIAFSDQQQQPLNSIQKVIQKVGGHHRFQYFSFIIFFLQWVTASFILLGLNFLFKKPTFNTINQQTQKEAQNRICKLPKNQRNQYIQIVKGQTLTTQFGQLLICQQQYIVRILQSLTYVGGVLGFYLIGVLSDNYGRKLALNVSWIIFIIGIVNIGIAQNFYMIGVGLFFAGFGCNPAITLHYSFINQQCIGHIKQYFGAALQIAYALGEILIAALFLLYQKWRVNVLAQILTLAVICGIGHFFILQTPKFLLSKNYSKCLKVLNKMAKINKKPQLQIRQIQKITLATPPKIGFLQLFTYKSVRVKAICSGIIFFCIQIVYYGVIFILDTLGAGIYYNQMIIGSSQLVGYLSAEYIAPRYNRKIFLYIGFTLVALIYLVLFFIVGLFLQRFIYVIRFILCCIWSLYYIFAAEMFPTTIRSIGMSFTSMGGMIGSSFTPFISGASLLGVFMTCPLKETFNKEQQQQIQQVKLQKEIKKIKDQQQQKAMIDDIQEQLLKKTSINGID